MHRKVFTNQFYKKGKWNLFAITWKVVEMKSWHNPIHTYLFMRHPSWKCYQSLLFSHLITILESCYFHCYHSQGKIQDELDTQAVPLNLSAQKIITEVPFITMNSIPGHCKCQYYPHHISIHYKNLIPQTPYSNWPQMCKLLFGKIKLYDLIEI